MNVKKIPSGRAAVNAAYGVPGPEGSEWYQENIMNLDLEHPLFYENDNGTLKATKSIRVHRLAAPNFLAVFLSIWLYARAEVKKKHGYKLSSAEYDTLTTAWLKDRELTDYNGTYNFRPTRGSSTAYSGHAYGIAIDMDASDNPLGSKKTTFPDWYIQLWKDQGFFWGGDYKSRPDPMHFILAKGI